MLNRQKILLQLLVSASRPVSQWELTQWAFLLREETPSRGGSAFYDFLPSECGPCSFCLTHEIRVLMRDGYVQEEGDDWCPTALAEEAVASLPRCVVPDGRRIVERFKSTRPGRLADYVSRRYPRFQLEQRPSAAPAVYTTGYESLSVDAFLGSLMHHGIEQLIDVRNHPVSRRYGFHKTTLSRLASRVGIAYRHVPELGIESSLRKGLSSPHDYDALFEVYERETIALHPQSVDRVAQLMQERPSVLVCMEADPRFCHRARLAKAVAEKTCLNVRDLRRGV